MIINILKFLIKSSNQHGVHSPFVYQLVTKAFYQKSSKNIQDAFIEYRQKLKSSSKEISVLDLGSGSKKMKTKQRSVADIAKSAAIPTRYALLMNRVVKHLHVKNVLELGTSLGVSTYALLKGNVLDIDTIEGCPETLKIAKSSLIGITGNTNVSFYNGDFNEVLNSFSEEKKYDLIFFDGNHKKEPTLTYFQKCLKHKHNDTVFVFDDIYWSKEMMDAWQEIKKHKDVSVTVDLFKLGFVFFRQEQKQAKEHFKIRF